MNRKVMRKSTLISSIAMLLVAVLALSGVTFAWFSSKPTATAGNVTMTSSTASGLYIGQSKYKGIETAPDSWESSLTWTVNTKLTPASCAFVDGNDTFYTTTSNEKNGAWKDAYVSTTTTQIDADDESKELLEGHYIAQRIWLDADLGDTAQNLVMTVNFVGNNVQPYSRFVIVNDKTKEATVFANNTTMYYPIISVNNVTVGEGEDAVLKTTAINVAEEGNGVTPELTSVPYTLIQGYDGEPVSYTVYFFLEGQDATCNNANSRSDVTVNLVFTLENAT